MTFVRNFDNFSPPRRDDGVVFTTVTIKENAVPTYTTATTLETKSLSPLDTDASNPVARSFTTSKATLVKDGYYWLVWADAAGNQYVDDPVQNTVGTELTKLELLIRSEFSSTWEGLVSDKYIGLPTIRLRIANVKAVLLPTVLANQDDDGWTPLLQAYVAKKVALDLIPAGIEYWMRQRISLSATGTNETKTLPDPIGSLKELAKSLAVQVAQIGSNPDIIGLTQGSGEAPAVSFGGDLITANPYEFPPAFATDETVGQERTS